MSKILAYISLTKPIVTISVYYTWLITFLVASMCFDVEKFVLESIVILLGIMWGNAMNNYLDRDIDAIMRRTRYKRVLPRGLLTVEEARKFCTALGVTSVLTTALVSAYYRDYVTPILYGIAMLTYVYLYTAVLKRKTWTSILVAAIAYMCVLLHAWYTASGRVDLPGMLISLLGYFWVLTHLWAIAMHWAEDYALADVPTITVRFWKKPIIPMIALFIATTLTMLLAVTPALFNIVSPFYIPAVLSVMIAEYVLLAKIAVRDWRTSKHLTYVCYKLTYPMLATIFTALIVCSFLPH